MLLLLHLLLQHLFEGLWPLNEQGTRNKERFLVENCISIKQGNSKTLQLEVADLRVGFLVSIIQLSPLQLAALLFCQILGSVPARSGHNGQVK